MMEAVLDHDEEVVQASRPFILLRADQVQARHEALVKEACSLFLLPALPTHYLLQAHKWDLQFVAEKLIDKSAAEVCKLHGFQLSGGKHDPPADAETLHCSICLMPRTYSEAFAAKTCGHWFCNECWRFCINARIAEGTANRHIFCMQKDCTVALSELDITEFIKHDDAAVKRFLEQLGHLVSDFALNNPRIKICPAKGCGQAVLCGSSDDIIKCLCGSRWCFQCHSEQVGDHRPATCKNVYTWVQKELELSEANWKWIRENTKQCPSCGVRIEKNQGCMHITCAKCKFEFCWLCKGQWQVHGKKCNQYVPHAESDTYMFFYQRFDSWKAAYSSASARIAEIEYLIPSTEAQIARQQTHFIVIAWHELLENRRVLQWSYAYGYCHDKTRTNERELFEFCQATLERLTDRLSKLLETSPSDLSDLDAYKESVIRVTETCARYRERFVSKTKEGLTGTPLAPIGEDAIDSLAPPTGHEAYCPLCFIATASSDELLAHMLGAHPEAIEGEAGTCDKCSFPVLFSKAQHDALYHAIEIPPTANPVPPGFVRVVGFNTRRPDSPAPDPPVDRAPDRRDRMEPPWAKSADKPVNFTSTFPKSKEPAIWAKVAELVRRDRERAEAQELSWEQDSLKRLLAADKAQSVQPKLDLNPNAAEKTEKNEQPGQDSASSSAAQQLAPAATAPQALKASQEAWASFNPSDFVDDDEDVLMAVLAAQVTLTVPSTEPAQVVAAESLTQLAVEQSTPVAPAAVATVAAPASVPAVAPSAPALNEDDREKALQLLRFELPALNEADLRNLSQLLKGEMASRGISQQP